jgi:putative ABC transport system permease protein
VLALLTVTVGAAIALSSATYNTFGVSENAVFGSANHRFEVDDPDRRTLPDAVADAGARFDSVDVVSRWSRAVPGSVESVEYRAQDPRGPFSAPMLDLRDGVYPNDGNEVAVTDGIADMLQIEVGEGDMVDLDGRRRTVVGMIENPSDLNSEFVLVAPNGDELAETVTILIGGTGEFDEVRAIRDFGAEHLANADVITRGDVKRVEAAAAVLGTAQAVLVLVSLVAAAGFTTLAQRRLKQLGMLGAVGATEKHLRLVVIANGAVIGMVAALLGAGGGLATWIAIAPRVERSAGHRIDPLNAPWVLIVSAMVLVVATATGAAWWPARTISRMPIISALSGRPPTPQPAHHSAAAAGALITIGLGLLAWGGRSDDMLMSTGSVAMVVGVLLLSPVAIGFLATVARPLPVAMRLALRDLARYRARSGIALAAVSLALGVPVAIVVTASAAEASTAIGNLSERQMLIWTRDSSHPEGVSPFFTQDPSDDGFSPYLPDLTSADVGAFGTRVDQIAVDLGDARVVGLDVVIDPQADDDPAGRTAVTLARPTDIGYLDVALLYVASEPLLASYGVDLAAVDTDADILTTAPSGPPDMVVAGRDEVWLANMSSPPELVTNVAMIDSSYTSLPGSFITTDALRERRWESTRVGWLVESDTPLTDEQIAGARETTAGVGLLLEVGQENESLVALRWGATAAGLLLALGVLAMTVGLIRVEASRDVRTLTATGATSTIRRALTASTAGGLALLGALLGTAGAYLGLSAGYLGDLGSLTPVPVVHLAAICLGAPALAALAGWLLAGREPSGLAGQVLD